MGENDQNVKRRIAELDFGTQKAEQDLDKIREKLEKLNGTSDTVFGNIQKSLNNSFGLNAQNVNLDNVKQVSKSVSDYQTKLLLKEESLKRTEIEKSLNYAKRAEEVGSVN